MIPCFFLSLRQELTLNKTPAQIQYQSILRASETYLETLVDSGLGTRKIQIFCIKKNHFLCGTKKFQISF